MWQLVRIHWSLGTRLHMANQRLLGVIASVFLLSAVGCTQHAESASHSGWEKPSLPATLQRVDANFTTPLDTYRLTRAEGVDTQKALAKIASECMARYGFTELVAGGDYLGDRFPDLTQSAQLFGTLTVQQAKQYAYSPPPGSPAQIGRGFYIDSLTNFWLNTGQDDVLPEDNARLNAAFNGPSHAEYFDENGVSHKLAKEQMPVDQKGNLPPADGCLGEAIRAGGKAPDELVEVRSETINLALTDKNMLRVQKSWSSCMASKGYKYKHVYDAVREGIGISPRSVQIAVADAECTEKTRWPDTFYALLSAYEKQAINKEPERFTDAYHSAKEFMRNVINGSQSEE